MVWRSLWQVEVKFMFKNDVLIVYYQRSILFKSFLFIGVVCYYLKNFNFIESISKGVYLVVCVCFFLVQLFKVEVKFYYFVCII